MAAANPPGIQLTVDLIGRSVWGVTAVSGLHHALNLLSRVGNTFHEQINA